MGIYSKQIIVDINFNTTGSCTLNNVWFEDVCEDAITIKQESGTSYINGGGAFVRVDLN